MLRGHIIPPVYHPSENGPATSGGDRS
jgi:hypothetical protein